MAKIFRTLFPLFFWLCPLVLFAQEVFAPQKTVQTINIDGVLDEKEWENALPVVLDFEVSPGNNVVPKVETTGYITYTNTHLYVGFYAKDKTENIRASVRQRDSFGVWSDDLVMLRLDTYADGRNNYLLMVNPLGSQLDIRQINAIKEEEQFDSSFNVDFESAGTIVGDGYQVEFKIPFASLPFPNGEDQEWHFTLFRKNYQQGNEVFLRSQPLDRDNACEICQTTDRLILKGIEIDKRFELLPYVAGNISGQRPSRDQPINYNSINPNAGLGMNLDLNKNSSLELTFNPDFSQVEADVTQIDVNSSFALEYPERRPFFNRGTDIVKFSDGAFYSRSINNPLVSSKLLSQGKKGRLYFLTAWDQNTPYQIAGEDRSFFGQGGNSFVNVFRYQHLLSKNSRMGLVTTSRFHQDGGYGNLVGTDGWFLLSKKWRLSYEVFVNFNKEPIADWIETDETAGAKTAALDGEKFSGDALYVEAFRSTEHWKSFFAFRNIAPDYQADVGFVVKNNRRWTTLYHEYQSFFERKALQFFSLATKADLLYTFDNNFKSASIDGIFKIRTYFNTDISYTYDFDVFKNFKGRDYKNLGVSQLDIRSTPSESFSLFMNMTFGKDIAYNEDIPDVGKDLSLFIRPSFQLSNKFSLSPSLRYARLRKLDSKDYYFNGYIGRFTIRYQFNNDLSIRLVSEYNDFTERFFLQPLMQWNPNPSTVFYIGGNQNSLEDFNSEFYSPFRVDETQFYVKFQYLIGL